jgi:gluconolactonase
MHPIPSFGPLALLLPAVFLASCTSETPPQAMPGPQTIGSVERLDPAIDAIVPEGAVLEILDDGHEWTEGPVWVPELDAVLF